MVTGSCCLSALPSEVPPIATLVAMPQQDRPKAHVRISRMQPHPVTPECPFTGCRNVNHLNTTLNPAASRTCLYIIYTGCLITYISAQECGQCSQFRRGEREGCKECCKVLKLPNGAWFFRA